MGVIWKAAAAHKAQLLLEYHLHFYYRSFTYPWQVGPKMSRGEPNPLWCEHLHNGPALASHEGITVLGAGHMGTEKCGVCAHFWEPYSATVVGLATNHFRVLTVDTHTKAHHGW